MDAIRRCVSRSLGYTLLHAVDINSQIVVDPKRFVTYGEVMEGVMFDPRKIVDTVMTGFKWLIAGAIVLALALLISLAV